MGFRSTFVTEDYWLPVPQWFVDKYKDAVHFGTYTDKEGLTFKNMPFSSKFERKFYAGTNEELFKDMQEVLNTQTESNIKDFELVLFHECTGITKVHIGKDFIRMYEPSDWQEVGKITHNYCYGCSTPEHQDKVTDLRLDSPESEKRS